MTTHPVAIIGAGPVGLAAAAHLAQRNLPFVVLEAGPQIGASVRAWGHVRLFSPWRYLVDSAAAALLAETGWQSPDDTQCPTGAELVEGYLAPLAAYPALAPQIRSGTRVLAVSRMGRDKLKDTGRPGAPFVLHLETATGEERLLAQAVIDASGTYAQPNPAGADGLLAVGERAAARHIRYGVPDALGAERPRYAGRRVLVLGSGHSAFNALLDLAQLPETPVTWAVRRTALGQLFGGGAADELSQRGALGSRVATLVGQRGVTLQTGFALAAFSLTADGVLAHGADGQQLGPFDEIVVCTGFRPDLELLRELRLGLDASVEAPIALAPLIDPNVHSCGSVPPHGAVELGHPEPGFYMVGMKSYGRAPTFLLLTGYEQVRSVTAALAGDWAAARDVRLVLPETGVCSGPLAGDGAACCAPPVPSRATLELIPLSAGGSGALAAAACCAPAVQLTCCAPDEKAACCDPVSRAGSCGCQ